MTKEMIISSSAHETRVAILEEDQVAEVFIERERSRGVVGNLYKGRVSKVLPGMQSAFVDLGLERDGFLYVSDVVATFEEFDRLETDEDDAAGANGNKSGARSRAPGRARAAGGGNRRDRGEGPRAQDRRAGQGRAGDHRAGGQGAARHEGRPPHLPRHHAGPLPGVHADRGPRRRVAQDRIARGARPAARHRPRVPRAARLHRRRHHPHRGRRAAQGRHRLGPELLPQGLDRDPPEVRDVAGAGGGLPRGEPRRQAPPRPAHRGVLGHPHRQRARVPQDSRAHRADHAVARAEGAALREAVPDLRGIRRAGRDRQGAAQQGVAQVGRLHRDQPDRGAGGDRRQHRPLRRQEDGRAPRGHHPQDQPRSGQGDRAAGAAARPRRHHRPRLHRHGGQEEPAEGAAGRRAASCARTARRRRRCRCRTSAW